MYMGVASLKGMQFIDRVEILFMPAKYQPDHIYLRHVPMRKVHFFTIIQVSSLIRNNVDSDYCLKKSSTVSANQLFNHTEQMEELEQDTYPKLQRYKLVKYYVPSPLLFNC